MQPNINQNTNQTPATPPVGQPVPAAAPVQPAPQAPPPATAKPAPANSNPTSTQNTLQIAAIRDGIAIMADGSFRAVVMAKSINFDLMSEAEQAAVEYAYQGFLNSLYFDIQVFIRSRRIDMRPYLEHLGKIRTEMDNMLLAMLMEDYIYFIDGLVEETNIMSKQFYIVVPFYSTLDAQKAVQASKKVFEGITGGAKKSLITIDEVSLEKAKTELKNRVQSIINGLQQMGIQAIPLDTQELIELYYNAYNPDTATRQTLKEMEQLTTPMITKGDGRAPKPNLAGEF